MEGRPRRGWEELGLGSAFLLEAMAGESRATSLSSLPSCQVADSEVKAGTLQLTVERLNGALAKMGESEGALRDKAQGLSEALAQNSANLTSTQDKNLHLQKALTACEHDRQVLQVWGCRGLAGVGGTVRVSQQGQAWRGPWRAVSREPEGPSL